MSIFERLVLALLRRFGPHSSSEFREAAISIVASSEIDRLLAVRDRAGLIEVEAGPFAGMRLRSGSRTTGHIAKVLGLYESQLVPIMRRAAARKPDSVINIGCGDGYYLIAAGQLLPDAALIGFEANDAARSEADANLADNGLAARARLAGFCDVAALGKALTDASLLIVDCEGGEADLLDPDRLPALRHTAMIVELHDFARPGVSDTLQRRFAASHRIEIVAQEKLLPSTGADLAAMPETLLLAVISECRPQLMRWAWFEPRPRAA